MMLHVFTGRKVTRAGPVLLDAPGT